MNETACLYYIQIFFRPILVFLCLSSCLTFLFSNMHTHKHILIADLFSVLYKVYCFSSLSLKCLFHLSGSAKAITVLASFLPSGLFFPLFFFTLCLQPLGHLEFCTCNSCKNIQMINLHNLTCVILVQKVGSVRWTDFSSSSELRSQMVDTDILILRRIKTST